MLSMSLYGVLMFTRGLGSVLSTPVSTALAPVQLLSSTDSGSKQGFVLGDGRFSCLIGYIVACRAPATLILSSGGIGRR